MCYINGHEASLTERGVLGFVNKTICALSDNLQITEDIHTAFTPRCGLPLFNTSLAQPEEKMKSQQKLHAGKQLPFLSLSLSFQIPSQHEWQFLWACSKNAFHNFAGTYSSSITVQLLSCGLYKAWESFEKLAFSVFILTQGGQAFYRANLLCFSRLVPFLSGDKWLCPFVFLLILFFLKNYTA